MQGVMALLMAAISLVCMLGMVRENIWQERTSEIPFDTPCTSDTKALCMEPIRRALMSCSIVSERYDELTSIKCLKDLTNERRWCWPCICPLNRQLGGRLTEC